MVGRPVSLRSEVGALGLAEALRPETETETVGTDPTAIGDTVGGPGGRPTLTAVDPVLRVRGAVVIRRDGSRALDGVDLEVRAGEIVGVAGIEGNGQTDLADVLASLLPLDAGTVEVAGRLVPTGRAGAMADARVGMIPEDRHDAGCVLDMTVAENLHLGHLARGAALRAIDRGAMRRTATDLIAEYDIACGGPDAPFRSLSGGNQQRVVLARELTADPLVLVAAQPTRGLDVGAIEFMGSRLRAVAAAGVGVLLISSELEEIFHLADRIVVMHAGRIVGEMPRRDADLERIGLLMGGAAA